jgi:hypothetical protein
MTKLYFVWMNKQQNKIPSWSNHIVRNYKLHKPFQPSTSTDPKESLKPNLQHPNSPIPKLACKLQLRQCPQPHR